MWISTVLTSQHSFRNNSLGKRRMLEFFRLEDGGAWWLSGVQIQAARSIAPKDMRMKVLIDDPTFDHSSV